MITTVRDARAMCPIVMIATELLKVYESQSPARLAVDQGLVSACGSCAVKYCEGSFSMRFVNV